MSETLFVAVRKDGNSVVGSAIAEGRPVPHPDKPRGRLTSAYAGWEDADFRLVRLDRVGFASPGAYFHRGEDIVGEPGADSVTVTRQWTAWTQEEIDAQIAAQKQAALAALDNANDAVRQAIVILLQRQNAIISAINGGGSLPAIKAALPAVQTAAELRDAVLARLGGS